MDDPTTDTAAEDVRVNRLWEILDTQRAGHLDLDGLKRGLRKMDHRKSNSVLFSCLARLKLIRKIALKDADALLQDVLKAVDTNGDGVIKYSGIHNF